MTIRARLRLPVLLLAAALATLGAACTLARPLHGLTCEPGAGDASCLYGQACERDGDCATTACVTGSCQCPQGMVTIDSTICIDATEVTNAAYRRFLATKPDPSAQEAVCASNGTFAFDEGAPASDSGCLTRHKEDDFPASCIDWCDAKAFCKSLGKHLCGKMHGGANPESAMADAAQSEWFDACSMGGTRVFATDAYDPAGCNVDSMAARAVGSPAKSQCEGGYFGLFDMSGNVGEWEDSCSGNTGPGDTCLTRGGTFDLGGVKQEYQCSASAPHTRDDTYFAIGFRCCSG